MSDLESDFAREADETEVREAFDMEAVPRPGLHIIKSHPRCFQKSLSGKKKHELRRDDRGYREGDKILMHEWDPRRGGERVADGYTGRWLAGRITCATRPEDAPDGGLAAGYVILSITWQSASEVPGSVEGVEKGAND